MLHKASATRSTTLRLQQEILVVVQAKVVMVKADHKVAASIVDKVMTSISCKASLISCLEGHNKADCPNPRVERPFTGTCRTCNQEG